MREQATVSIRILDPNSTEYSCDYNSGWRAGQKYTEVNGLNPQQRADQRNVSDAWYDGYTDADAGRPKWTWRTARRRGFGELAEMYDADANAETAR
jgi:hypothetical protein